MHSFHFQWKRIGVALFQRALLFCIMITVGVYLTGCSTLSSFPMLELSVKKGRPFIIAESLTAYGWGVMSHPRVIKISDSVLILQYYTGGDAPNVRYDNPAGRKLSGLPPAVSRDGGKTWEFEGAGLDTNVLHHCNYWGYDISTTNGVILGVGKSAVLVDENAKMIDGPWDVTISQNGFKAGGPWHHRISRPSGELMASTYADKYTIGKQTVHRIHTMRSTNHGHSWEIMGLLADSQTAPWGSEGPNESTIVCLTNGSLICVMRTGYDPAASPWDKNRPTAPLLLSRSDDGGRNWNHNRMRIAGVYPRLLLMSNGVLVLATGRPGNSLYFSIDGGFSWGNELALTPADVRTTGYCDIIEVEEGRLLAVFDMYDTDTSGIWLWEPEEVNGVFGVFVDVNKRL